MKEDTFNIMIASDIHLGYNESDPIRGEDSFITFEEILSTAVKKDVDFILLGGDLFHDNKPSQRCLYRCMSLLRRYCMGDRPVPVEFLSDPSESFRHCDNPVVNYEDENLNISMPVFSIHGNHDDPSGHGWVSSLDLLSVSGLVNYFGKWSDLKEVSISPLLLRKGQSHLALYGLSHIKDERLSRIFRDGKAKFYRPRELTDEWFNLFVLHQNRANRGPNNFIAESALPDFLDLVLWGHEHECRIAPELAEGGKFYITQPGSPVATSLCEGEAKEKHCAILKIRKKNFKLDLIPLRTVRPFIYDTITLSKCNINMGDASKPSHAVQNYVSNYVQNMLDSAARQLSGDPKQPLIPLVRLRVEYADETQMFNEIRFGQMYQEKVANPQDMVMLRKERADGKKNTTSDAKLDRHLTINVLSTKMQFNPDELIRLRCTHFLIKALRQSMFVYKGNNSESTAMRSKIVLIRQATENAILNKNLTIEEMGSKIWENLNALYMLLKSQVEDDEEIDTVLQGRLCCDIPAHLLLIKEAFKMWDEDSETFLKQEPGSKESTQD